MNTYTIVILYVGGTETIDVKAHTSAEAYKEAAQWASEQKISTICSMTLMGYMPFEEKKGD